MEIIDEGALDKSLRVTERTLDKKPLQENLWGHWQWLFQTTRCWFYKRLSIKIHFFSMFIILSLLMSKIQFKESVLNMACSIRLLKSNGKLLENKKRLQKENENKNFNI